MDYNDVIQLKLKTPEDLVHHLRTNGLAQHVIHDSESDWWWFCDHRNKLLEFVFNSGSSLTFRKTTNRKTKGTRWVPKCNLIPNMKNFELCPTFIYATITEETLVDLFWNDFLSQDLGPYAYWDMDNPDNGFEEFVYYWEMQAGDRHKETISATKPKSKSA